MSRKVIFTYLENLLDLFTKYVKDLNSDDYSLLVTGFEGGKQKEWANKGTYSNKLRDIFRKYFRVKIAFIPWQIPQCGGGIFCIIDGEINTLEDIINKVGPIGKIMTNDEAAREINSVFL